MSRPGEGWRPNTQPNTRSRLGGASRVARRTFLANWSCLRQYPNIEAILEPRGRGRGGVQPAGSRFSFVKSSLITIVLFLVAFSGGGSSFRSLESQTDSAAPEVQTNSPNPCNRLSREALACWYRRHACALFLEFPAGGAFKSLVPTLPSPQATFLPWKPPWKPGTLQMLLHA